MTQALFPCLIFSPIDCFHSSEILVLWMKKLSDSDWTENFIVMNRKTSCFTAGPSDANLREIDSWNKIDFSWDFYLWFIEAETSFALRLKLWERDYKNKNKTITRRSLKHLISWFVDNNFFNFSFRSSWVNKLQSTIAIQDQYQTKKDFKARTLQCS